MLRMTLEILWADLGGRLELRVRFSGGWLPDTQETLGSVHGPQNQQPRGQSRAVEAGRGRGWLRLGGMLRLGSIPGSTVGKPGC